MNATNPPAFPQAITILDGRPTISPGELDTGMSLRDWFAGMALQGKFAAGHSTESYTETAGWCYQAADAMLAERAKK